MQDYSSERKNTHVKQTKYKHNVFQEDFQVGEEFSF